MSVVDLRPPSAAGLAGRRTEVVPEARSRRTRAQVVANVERTVAFVVPLVVFLAFAYDLVIVHHSQIQDAYSRMANGYYVFWGKDPHLAAIGFVWQPLQSMIDMPLMFLRTWFPDLTRLSFSADIASSFCMAGASYQVYRTFEELRLGRITRWLLLAGLLVNPMVVYFASNGMSEALFIFTLAGTTRYLLHWLATGRTRSLLGSAVWLGLAYADRNEAAAAALAGLFLVAVVTYRRCPAVSVSVRRHTAFMDAALFCAPFALVFVGWAVTSKLIVGSFFEQFSSIYGNSSQLASQGYNQGAHLQHLSNLVAALHVTLNFAPVYPVVVIAALVRAWRLREPAILAVLAIFGGVEAFELATYSLGKLANQDRYFIYVIPMTILCLACLARPLPVGAGERRAQVAEAAGRFDHLGFRRRTRMTASAVLAAVAVLAPLPGLPTTWHEMFHTTFGHQERDLLDFVLYPGSAAARRSPYREQYNGILAATGVIDGLRAGEGQVMVDNFDECIPAVILASDNPDQFEIPNDEHYDDVFGVPYQFGVRYIIVPKPTAGTLNSIDRNYPTLYATGTVAGAPFGTLTRQFSIQGCGAYRIYRLLPSGNSLG